MVVFYFNKERGKNMEKSKVYFTDFRARPGYNLLQKLEKLMKKAGIEMKQIYNNICKNGNYIQRVYLIIDYIDINRRLLCK